MRTKRAFSVLIASVFLVGACAVMPPPGPSHPAMMGQGKTPAQYVFDDNNCRSLAQTRTGMTPGEAAGQSMAGSVVTGALGGAGLGAAAGAAGGEPGIGAAVGAAAGFLLGIFAGSQAGSASAEAFQRKYDAEYGACMYAAGHQVAGYPAPRQVNPPPPPPPPAYQPSIGPKPAEAAPCEPTGKYVKTPGGFVQECKFRPDGADDASDPFLRDLGR